MRERSRKMNRRANSRSLCRSSERLDGTARSGMITMDDVAQFGGLEVGVLLGCGELLVTEQDLDVADVHSRLQEMGGAGMAKQVRRDVLLDAGLVSILLENW